MHISTGKSDSIFLGVMPLFEHRNLTKIEDTTQNVCQRNSTETAQHNFVKLRSYET